MSLISVWFSVCCGFFLVFFDIITILPPIFMRISPFNTALSIPLICLISSTALVGNPSALEVRITELESRLSALESRLVTNEKATHSAQMMAAGARQDDLSGSSYDRTALDIMANSAWRNLRWTRSQQWSGVKSGASEAKVIELLGKPPRSVKSLKPRIDKVFYYETSLGDQSSALSGTISFRDGIVVSVRPPNFQAQETN